MKKFLFLLLAVFTMTAAFSQAKPSEKQDTAKAKVVAPQVDTAAAPQVQYLLGTEADFQVLERVVANFKGASYVEVAPVLEWLRSRKKLDAPQKAAEPPKK